MTVSLERSFAYCRALTRRRAKNFYYSFVLLPKAEHDAICAIYAFMRYCDDLSDEPGASRAKIEKWQGDLRAGLRGEYGDHPVWPAFHDVVQRYGIPHRYFDEMIDGVSSDLGVRRFQTFHELYGYCYQVASVAGLCVIHIFGFDSPRAPILAEKCGIAFQLTNILRDVREDAGRGRIYFPAEDLERFQVDPEDILAGRRTDALVELLRFEGQRARAYYLESGDLVGLVRRRNRTSLWALIEIYRRLLERIEASGYDVMERRIRLPSWEKAWVVVQAALRREAKA